MTSRSFAPMMPNASTGAADVISFIINRRRSEEEIVLVVVVVVEMAAEDIGAVQSSSFEHGLETNETHNNCSPTISHTVLKNHLSHTLLYGNRIQ
mmetsp:Transcript_38943/g.42202  ORF Transcript_38943/g.42202 Transcript_38943/m.42202 type:complete len:95 (-) Transcript_38943:53-337(-)